MERRDLEIALHLKLHHIALVQLPTFQTPIKLPEPWESGEAHPHNEVLVLHAAPVIVGLGGVIGAVFGDLGERLITTRGAGGESYMYWRVALGWP